MAEIAQNLFGKSLFSIYFVSQSTFTNYKTQQYEDFRNKIRYSLPRFVKKSFVKKYEF